MASSLISPKIKSEQLKQHKLYPDIAIDFFWGGGGGGCWGGCLIKATGPNICKKSFLIILFHVYFTMEETFGPYMQVSFDVKFQCNNKLIDY